MDQHFCWSSFNHFGTIAYIQQTLSAWEFIIIKNMKNKSILIYILALLLNVVCIPGNGAASETIKWYSYDDAKTLEKENSNKVFLYFYSINCYYCGLMEKNTFSSSIVSRYLNQNFIPVKVNSDKERTISSTYNIRGNPTSYFLTENFEVIGNLPGYLPPKDMLNILQYIHTDSFKKMTFNDFLQKK